MYVYTYLNMTQRQICMPYGGYNLQGVQFLIMVGVIFKVHMHNKL